MSVYGFQNKSDIFFVLIAMWQFSVRIYVKRNTNNISEL